jgi:hypothetical protein
MSYEFYERSYAGCVKWYKDKFKRFIKMFWMQEGDKVKELQWTYRDIMFTKFLGGPYVRSHFQNDGDCSKWCAQMEQWYLMMRELKPPAVRSNTVQNILENLGSGFEEAWKEQEHKNLFLRMKIVWSITRSICRKLSQVSRTGTELKIHVIGWTSRNSVGQTMISCSQSSWAA